MKTTTTPALTGTPSKGGALEFINWLDRFLQFVQCSKGTLKQYKSNLKHFLNWCSQQGLNPLQANHYAVLAYRQALEAAAAPATVNNRLSTVKRFYEWLEAEGIIAKNPAHTVKAIKVARDHKRDYLTDTERTNLLACCETLRERVALVLSITTGLRVNELASITRSDFIQKGSSWFIAILGKGHRCKDSFVKLPLEVKALVDQYLATHSCKTLFATAQGRRGIGVRGVMEMITRLLKRAGVKSITKTCHSLRHTFAIVAMKAGATLVEVSLALRHQSLQTTRIYTHQIELESNRAASLVAAAIGF